MARDDILSRDYVAPSRPIIQDPRKSEMWEKLLADSMDLLKMQTLSSQEIAREKRKEATDQRTSVRDLQNAESLLETEAGLKEEAATSKHERDEEERTRGQFENALALAHDAAAGNKGIWITELQALKEMPAYERYLTEIDRKITNAEKLQGFDRARSRAEQEVSELITPAALMKGPKAAEDALNAIHQKWPEGHILAGQPIFSAATRNSKSAALQVSLRSIGDEGDPNQQIQNNMAEITKINGQIIELDKNRLLFTGTAAEISQKNLDADEMVAELESSKDYYLTLNSNIKTLQRTKGLGGGATGETLYNKQVDYYKRTYNLGNTPEEEQVAIGMLTHYVAGVDIEDDQSAGDHHQMMVAQYGPEVFDIDTLRALRTKHRKSMKAEKLGPPTSTQQPQAVVGPTTRWGIAAAEFAARPPDPEVPETIAMTAEIQRELERFDVETQAKADQITDPAEKSDWLEKRASARKTRERVLTDVSQAKEAQVDIPSGTYTVQGKEIRVEPTTNVLGGVTGLNIYPSNNFALSDVLNIPKTNAGKKVRITKKRDEELFNQIVATLLASQ